jgi:hypothetical protein
MTFSPPFSGTFAYKGVIPSSFMNAINTDIGNALDKTGDSFPLGGISGRIDVLAGGSIQTNSTGEIIINPSGILSMQGEFGGGGQFNFTSSSQVNISSTACVFENGSATSFSDGSSLQFGQGPTDTTPMSVVFNNTSNTSVTAKATWDFESVNTLFTPLSITTMQGQFNLIGSNAVINIGDGTVGNIGAMISFNKYSGLYQAPTHSDFNLNGTTYLYGTLNTQSGGTLTASAGSTVNFGDANASPPVATILFQQNALVNFISGSNTFFDPGSILQIDTVFTILQFPTFIGTQSVTCVQSIVGGTNFGVNNFVSATVPNGTIIGPGISTGAAWYVPIQVHNGATLTSVQFNFSIADHTGLGISSIMPPQFDVIAVPIAAASGYVHLNSSFPKSMNFTPGSASSYSSQTTLVYTTNQHNVIDITNYAYFAVIYDESGSHTITGNAYGNVITIFSNITSSAWANV